VVEHSAKRAAEAVRNSPPPKMSCGKRCSAAERLLTFYRPVADLPARQRLVLELANDEKTVRTHLARDVAHNPDSSRPLNSATAIKPPLRWRCFSGNPRQSVIGGLHAGDRKEKGELENNLDVPTGGWIAITPE
jgi:hypothetical protein